MNAIADMTPLAAWDGGRRIAVALSVAPPDAIFTLIAHGPAASACVAVWEASAGACLAVLPEGAMHLDLSVEAPGFGPLAVPVELDGQLAPAMVDPAQPGLRSIVLNGTSLDAAQAPAGSALVAMNVLTGGAAGMRLRVGPVVRNDADDMVTLASASLAGGNLALSFSRHGRPSPVLVAFIPADPAALASRADDLTGVSGKDAERRGFALLQPGEHGGLVLTPFRSGDRAVVFSPRNHRISAPGAARPGTRLVLTAGPGEALEVAVTVHAYRPATSTAMAALSGGGVTDEAEDGRRDALSNAAAVAEAFWRRHRIGLAEPSGHLAAMRALLAPTAAHPLAGLTLTAADLTDASVSPLVAAIGAALECPPALVEEIEALPAVDRAALAAWTALEPATAAAAVQARLILPIRGDRQRDGMAATAALAADSARPALRALVERLAGAAAPMADREAVQAAERVAQTLGEVWIPVEDLASALALLKRHPAPVQAVSGLTTLLAEIRKNAAAWTAAQAEARTADLGAIAEKRALIPVAAVGAGLAPDVLGEIEDRLKDLNTEEIILLQRHLTSAAGRQALIRGVRLAIQAMDEAAASGGLAGRMDRSGDPLVGMTRIGSAAEPVMRELARMPQARDALVALNSWINACVPAPEPGHTLSERLVRNVKSYGCFLLMHAVAAECRKLIGPTTEGGAAFTVRLSSGLTETLPQLAIAAAARAGDDIRLGLSFTERLPSLHGRAAP